ncbi:SurA N-terminal domain-containing protein [Brevibacillus brevis]|uniref:SurA N-terminal domain-containing protein n=1 Tax=Brevibacillus brevis TaxID=1393 RepID=UPI0025A51A38|nr:SurA N-terminal domain-containing protein [Brevibacillus brevis]WJQ80798.1 SurA N-terminal domain-containing protein [Brevibacillus brevis]
MKKFDISMLTVAILVTGLAVLGFYQSWAKGNDPVLVTAGDTSITQNQLYGEMKKTYGKSTIHELVAEALIKQEAKAQNVAATQEDMNKEIDSMKKQVGSPEAFQNYLKSMGMTETQLRDKLNVLMTRDKLLDKAFPVTEEQIKTYYNTNKAQLGSPAPEFDKVKDQIKMMLTDQSRSQNYSTWLNTLQDKHKVEWNDPSFDDPSVPGEEQIPAP